jgi:hypothetical protein
MFIAIATVLITENREGKWQMPGVMMDCHLDGDMEGDT